MMTRGVSFLVVLVCASLCSVGLVAWASGPGEGVAALKFEPVAPVESLMHAQDDRFTAIKDYIATSDEKDPRRFDNMAHQAFILAELGNVNQFNRKAKDYQDWARAIRDEALALADAAMKKDLGEVKAAAKRIHSNCKSCHDVYK